MSVYSILSIRNTVNNKMYFAVCRIDKFYRVIKRYKLLLEYNLHPNIHLQNSYNYYGNTFEFEHQFRFYTYEKAELTRLALVKGLKSDNGKFGYNYIGSESING